MAARSHHRPRQDAPHPFRDASPAPATLVSSTIRSRFLTNVAERACDLAEEAIGAFQHHAVPHRLAVRRQPPNAGKPLLIDAMAQQLIDYFRCPDELPGFETSGQASADEGYFRFGDAIGFGRLHGMEPTRYVTARMPEVAGGVIDRHVRLPFDLSDVVTNLRQERYRQTSPLGLKRVTASGLTQRAYYFLRPLLPVGVRKHLQKIRLSGWEKIAFPRWPVDFSVDTLMQNALALALKSGGPEEIPFIWFWPDGASSCAMMTHDVEGPSGGAFCSKLMDLDDSAGIRSAFQLVPEAQASIHLLRDLRDRGFEVNLHDLNHDGYLFHSKAQFLERVVQINRYAREFDCRGFRAGAMYREQQWFDAFELEYDMSVPNVAHLEPQRGGCCTVMPYFVGDLLELPLTTVQDYSLFHILGSYSTALWKQQIELIMSRHGLVSFITHPDYLCAARAQGVYLELLTHLTDLCAEKNLWIAPPGDVNDWWRNRHQMTLVSDGDSWRIEGPDCHRARLAHAALEGDRVVYRVARTV